MEELFDEDKESREVWDRAKGKVIHNLSLTQDPEDEGIHFLFTDGTKIRLYDSGQDCCENRYMRTDDDLSDYFGSTLIGAEIRDVPEEKDENGYHHEVQFLLVQTSKGTLTIASHNDHNGYYGGFCIQVCEDV